MKKKERREIVEPDELPDHTDERTRCRYCEAETHDLDYCPQCGRQVRREQRQRYEMDLCERMAGHPARRLIEGFRMSHRKERD